MRPIPSLSSLQSSLLALTAPPAATDADLLCFAHYIQHDITKLPAAHIDCRSSVAARPAQPLFAIYPTNVSPTEHALRRRLKPVVQKLCKS